MVLRYMPNSDPWGPPGTPFTTIFVFYVNPQIPNIEKFEAYEDYKSREVSHLFLIKFPVECRQNYVWRPIFDLSYDHIYKNIHFCRVRNKATNQEQILIKTRIKPAAKKNTQLDLMQHDVPTIM